MLNEFEELCLDRHAMIFYGVYVGEILAICISIGREGCKCFCCLEFGWDTDTATAEYGFGCMFLCLYDVSLLTLNFFASFAIIRGCGLAVLHVPLGRFASRRLPSLVYLLLLVATSGLDRHLHSASPSLCSPFFNQL